MGKAGYAKAIFRVKSLWCEDVSADVWDCYGGCFAASQRREGGSGIARVRARVFAGPKGKAGGRIARGFVGYQGARIDEGTIDIGGPNTLFRAKKALAASTGAGVACGINTTIGQDAGTEPTSGALPGDVEGGGIRGGVASEQKVKGEASGNGLIGGIMSHGCGQSGRYHQSQRRRR
jgi:hypothetical protein